MTTHDDFDQALYYNTLQVLAHNLARSADPELQHLGSELQAILHKGRGPLTRQRAVTQAIAALQPVEPARQQLQAALQDSRESYRLRAAYQPAPGKPGRIKPGPLLICPVEGCHYEQFFMQKGEDYRCPAHGVELKPKPKRGRGQRR